MKTENHTPALSQPESLRNPDPEVFPHRGSELTHNGCDWAKIQGKEFELNSCPLKSSRQPQTEAGHNALQWASLEEILSLV